MKQLKLAALLVLLSLMAVLVITLAGCGDEDEVEIVGTITGIVRDISTNAVLSGVTVFTDPPTKAAVTDADGRYSIADIKVKSYEVIATKSGYFDGVVIATVVENSTITVNFALEPDTTPTPGSITGVVTRADNGNPLAGASISTVPATATVITNAAGQYTITNVTAGSYQVNVTATGFTPASANVTVTAGQAAQGNFALTSNTQGSIAGVVTNSVTSLPLAGVSISTTPATTTVVTNASGQYQINSVAPGSYRVNASHTGYSAGYVDVTVTAGQQTTGDIALAPAPGSISGTIRNATTSATIAGVTVTTNPSTTTVVTDAGGQYLITSVPAGSYSVTANASGYEAATATASVLAGQNSSLDLNLVPFFAEIEDNGARPSANYVTPLMAIRGHIGPTGSDPDDYFRITMPAGVNHGLLRVSVQNLNGPGQGVVGTTTVYNADEVAMADNGGLTNPGQLETFALVPVTSGADYYLRVRGYNSSSEADYRLDPEFTPGQYTDPHTANNSMASAVPVAVGSDVIAMIGYGTPSTRNVEDWWAVQAPASGTLTVVVTNLHGTNVGAGVLGYVRIVNSANASMDHNGGITNEGQTETLGPVSVTPGATYYVKVAAYGTVHAAPYRISIPQ